MLTSITLQNFKGIGDAVTIPIRPLTIMFGKNSAGKSTVVQALHYAREVLLNNNPNADRTALGGTSIDLGGFRNLVHNHDLSKQIVLKFDFAVTELPSYDSFWTETLEASLAMTQPPESSENESSDYSTTEGARLAISTYQGDSFQAAMFEPVADEFRVEPTASVELTIAWSESLDTAIISKYTTWLGSEHAAQIETSNDARDFRWTFNADHLLFLEEESHRADHDPTYTEWDYSYILQTKRSLPEWGRSVRLVAEPVEEAASHGIGILTLTEMFVAPGEMLCNILSDLLYIGPIRETPARNFQPTNREDAATWANGLGAWTRLYRDGGALVQTVGDQLSSSYLKTGYSLELEKFREIPLDSDLMLSLLNRTVIDRIDDTASEAMKYPIKQRLMVVEEKSGLKLMPQDIGVGISQIVPVVVAAVDSFEKVIAIEQPELHLHPAVQAELGDLLITSAREKENTFFIETHSEHLILRVLRRIRETENEEDTGNASKIYPADVSLVYVEPSEEGTQFLSIPITGEGDLEKNVPGGFFAERAKELF